MNHLGSNQGIILIMFSQKSVFVHLQIRLFRTNATLTAIPLLCILYLSFSPLWPRLPILPIHLDRLSLTPPQISHRFHQIIVGNPLLYQRLFRYLSIHLSLLHLILCYFFHRYQSPTQQQRQFILTIRYNTQARMQWDRIHIHTTSHDSMHRYELNVGNR